jgi:hypothetical protein
MQRHGKTGIASTNLGNIIINMKQHVLRRLKFVEQALRERLGLKKPCDVWITP